MKRKGDCQIDGCDRKSNYKTLDLCHRCYQGLYYWRKKSVAQVIARKKQLGMWANRMDVAEPTIRMMPSRKRAGGRG